MTTASTGQHGHDQKPEHKHEHDPVKPFILVNVGVVTASVAILGAAFAGLANKDAPAASQSLFLQVSMYMSGVIIACTAAAIVLQVLRMCAIRLRAPKHWLFLRLCVILAIAVTWYPLQVGGHAAGVVFTAALDGHTGALPPPRATELPWVISWLHTPPPAH